MLDTHLEIVVIVILVKKKELDENVPVSADVVSEKEDLEAKLKNFYCVGHIYLLRYVDVVIKKVFSLVLIH